jgi:type I restriction enzyme M protein
MRRQDKLEGSKTSSKQLSALIKNARNLMRKDKGLSGDIDRLPMLTWMMFLKFLDDLELVRQEEAKIAGIEFRPVIEAPYRWRDWAAKDDGLTGNELLAFVNNEEALLPDGTSGQGLFAFLRSLRGVKGKDRRDVIAAVFAGTINRMINGYLLREVINKINEIHFTSSEEIYTLSFIYESMLREMRDAAGESGEFYTPRPVVRLMVELVNPQLGETILDPACGTGGFLVESFQHLSKQCKTVAHLKTLQHASIYGGEAKPLPYLLAQMNLLLHGVELPQITHGNSLEVNITQLSESDRVDVILTNPPFGGEEEKGILSNFPADKQTSETALLFMQLIARKLKKSSGKGGRCGIVVPESVMGDGGVAQKIRQDLVSNFNVEAVIRLPKGVFEPYSDIESNLIFFSSNGPTAGIWYYEHKVPSTRQDMRNPCYTRSHPLRYEELLPIEAWWKNKEETDRAWYVPLDQIKAKGFTFDFRNPNTPSIANVSVVDVATQMSDKLISVASQLNQFASGLEQLKNGKDFSARRIRLGEFLVPKRVEAVVEDDVEYDQVTVKLYGKGVTRRCRILGKDILTRPQIRAFGGHLIMSKIDARNGAFGLVPDELDGALITNDFPLFQVREDVILPTYLALILRSHGFSEACKRASRGTTNRKRLKIDLFLEEEITIPADIAHQKLVVILGTHITAAESSVQQVIRYLEPLTGSFSDYVQELMGGYAGHGLGSSLLEASLA